MLSDSSSSVNDSFTMVSYLVNFLYSLGLTLKLFSESADESPRPSLLFKSLASMGVFKLSMPGDFHESSLIETPSEEVFLEALTVTMGVPF